MEIEKSVDYRGFTIIQDKILGYSLIDRHGAWACSMISIEKIKNQIDKILE